MEVVVEPRVAVVAGAVEAVLAASVVGGDVYVTGVRLVLATGDDAQHGKRDSQQTSNVHAAANAKRNCVLRPCHSQRATTPGS